MVKNPERKTSLHYIHLVCFNDTQKILKNMGDINLSGPCIENKVQHQSAANDTLKNMQH